MSKIAKLCKESKKQTLILLSDKNVPTQQEYVANFITETKLLLNDSCSDLEILTLDRTHVDKETVHELDIDLKKLE